MCRKPLVDLPLMRVHHRGDIVLKPAVDALTARYGPGPGVVVIYDPPVQTCAPITADNPPADFED